MPPTPTPVQTPTAPTPVKGGHVDDVVDPGVAASIQELKGDEAQDSTETQTIPTTVQTPPPPTVIKGGQVDDVGGSGVVANTQELKGDDSPAIASVVKPPMEEIGNANSEGEAKPSGEPQGTSNVATEIIMTPNTPGSDKPEEPQATQVVVNSEASTPHSDDNASMTSQSSHAEEGKISQNDANLYKIPIPSDGDIGFTADCCTSDSRQCVVILLQKDSSYAK